MPILNEDQIPAFCVPHTHYLGPDSTADYEHGTATTVLIHESKLSVRFLVLLAISSRLD